MKPGIYVLIALSLITIFLSTEAEAKWLDCNVCGNQYREGEHAKHRRVHAPYPSEVEFCIYCDKMELKEKMSYINTTFQIGDEGYYLGWWCEKCIEKVAK